MGHVLRSYGPYSINMHEAQNSTKSQTIEINKKPPQAISIISKQNVKPWIGKDLNRASRAHTVTQRATHTVSKTCKSIKIGRLCYSGKSAVNKHIKANCVKQKYRNSIHLHNSNGLFSSSPSSSSCSSRSFVSWMHLHELGCTKAKHEYCSEKQRCSM